jgi:aminopeptidase YwaD
MNIINLKHNLSFHLQQIVRERDPYLATEGHFYVQQYIKQELEKYGEIINHQFSYHGKTHQNLILEIPGKKSIKPIIIGAHYDGVIGTPGADDNASGVAVLLELARHFQQYPLKYPLRLIAFDLEEYGLIGSENYAQSLKQKGEKIKLMLSLEMLGYCSHKPHSQKYPTGLKYFYPNQGNFIALVGNLGIFWELKKLAKLFKRNSLPCEILPVPFRGLPVLQTRLSDHASFWDAGYPALMVTDTAFLRNPNYHQVTDTIETLDLDFLTKVCQGLIEGLDNNYSYNG